MSKLVLSNRVPRDYNAASIQEIVRLIEEQSNQHAEGKLRARHGAQTAAPTSGNWEKGDFVWNSDPSATNNRVIYGWLCTVSGTPGTWVEVGVSTAVLAATQAEQEAASSTSVYSTPGRQQFHPSAAKAWGYITYSAGTPTLQASYNITSITDVAVGDVDITIATDFSSANYAIALSSQAVGTFNSYTQVIDLAAGVFTIQHAENTALADPSRLGFACFGDQ